MIHYYNVCLSSLDRTDKRAETNEVLYSAGLLMDYTFDRSVLSHHLHVMDLVFKLQIFLLQLMMFIRSSSERLKLILQHGLGLQENLIVLLQLLHAHI